MKKGAEALIDLLEEQRQRITAEKMEKDTERKKEVGLLNGEELVVEVNGSAEEQKEAEGDKDQRQKQDDVEILILGSLAGRVDHAIGILHEMLREQRPETSTFVKAYSSIVSSSQHRHHQSPQQHQRIHHTIPTPTLTLLSPSSVSFLLGPSSTNTIIHNSAHIGPSVGILPIYGPARITTKGLEWDVQDWETKMGDVVSTSNRFANGAAECVVQVNASQGHDEEGNWVVFTVERGVS